VSRTWAFSVWNRSKGHRRNRGRNRRFVHECIQTSVSTAAESHRRHCGGTPRHPWPPQSPPCSATIFRQLPRTHPTARDVPHNLSSLTAGRQQRTPRRATSRRTPSMHGAWQRRVCICLQPRTPPGLRAAAASRQAWRSKRPQSTPAPTAGTLPAGESSAGTRRTASLLRTPFSSTLSYVSGACLGKLIVSISKWRFRISFWKDGFLRTDLVGVDTNARHLELKRVCVL
jgi:hypothetical protein